MKKWFKHKEFPEIIESNSDLVAIIPDQKYLDRVVRRYNKLYSKILKLESDLNKADGIILDIHAQKIPHSKFSASRVKLWQTIRGSDATSQLKNFNDRELQNVKNVVKSKIDTLELTDDQFLEQFVKECGPKLKNTKRIK